MVATFDSKSNAARREGSSPSSGTKKYMNTNKTKVLVVVILLTILVAFAVNYFNKNYKITRIDSGVLAGSGQGAPSKKNYIILLGKFDISDDNNKIEIKKIDSETLEQVGENVTLARGYVDSYGMIDDQHAFFNLVSDTDKIFITNINNGTTETIQCNPEVSAISNCQQIMMDSDRSGTQICGNSEIKRVFTQDGSQRVNITNLKTNNSNVFSGKFGKCVEN